MRFRKYNHTTPAAPSSRKSWVGNVMQYVHAPLSEREKLKIQDKLAKRITQDGSMVLQCGETRSQHRNKAIIIERLLHILKQSLKVVKKRKKTTSYNSTAHTTNYLVILLLIISYFCY